ncbi:MAG: hypothetical protein FWH57_06115 [Oscillospiraceae bacterium]|nr:hypothetical protein [Oscillospiraceae bacterium]
MNTRKTIIQILLVLTAAIFVSCGGDNMRPEKTLKDFPKLIETEMFDGLSLTIHYISPSILTRAPLSVEGLINHSAVHKIVIDGNSLKEHIDLLKQINADALKPVKHKSHLDARLCYVFETDKDGMILDVVIGGDDNSIFVNGLEVKNNDVFYDVIRPFLAEDTAKELEVYFNRGNQE